MELCGRRDSKKGQREEGVEGRERKEEKGKWRRKSRKLIVLSHHSGREAFLAGAVGSGG